MPSSSPTSCTARILGWLRAPCGARFALKASLVLLAGEGARDNLDCDVSPESGIAGAVNLAHAAAPKHGRDFVPTEAPAWREHCPRGARSLEEAARLAVRGEQRLDFEPQRGVSAACRGQERRSCCRLALERGTKQLVDPGPAFRGHRFNPFGSAPAGGTATPSRGATLVPRSRARPRARRPPRRRSDRRRTAAPPGEPCPDRAPAAPPMRR